MADGRRGTTGRTAEHIADVKVRLEAGYDVVNSLPREAVDGRRPIQHQWKAVKSRESHVADQVLGNLTMSDLAIREISS